MINRFLMAYSLLHLLLSGALFLQLGNTSEVSYLQSMFISKSFKLYIRLYTEGYKFNTITYCFAIKNSLMSLKMVSVQHLL